MKQIQPKLDYIDQTRHEEMVLVYVRIFLTYLPFLTPFKQQTVVVAPYTVLPPNHYGEKHYYI